MSRHRRQQRKRFRLSLETVLTRCDLLLNFRCVCYRVERDGWFPWYASATDRLAYLHGYRA